MSAVCDHRAVAAYSGVAGQPWPRWRYFKVSRIHGGRWAGAVDVRRWAADGKRWAACVGLCQLGSGLCWWLALGLAMKALKRTRWRCSEESSEEKERTGHRVNNEAVHQTRCGHIGYRSTLVSHQPPPTVSADGAARSDKPT